MSNPILPPDQQPPLPPLPTGLPTWGEAVQFQLQPGGSTVRPAYKTVSPWGISNGKATTTNNGADYGPDTPGTTTSGIQEAINATIALYGAPQVFLLPGTFIVSSKIDPSNRGQALIGGVFRGSGKRLSIIQWGSGLSGTILGWNLPTSTLTDWTFTDFGVIGGSASGAPLVQFIQSEGGARHFWARFYVNDTAGLAEAFYNQGAEDCVVESFQTDTAAALSGPPAFHWLCPGGILLLIEPVLHTSQIQAAQCLIFGGACLSVAFDTAGVPSNITIFGLFWNGSVAVPITLNRVGSNTTFYLTMINCYLSGENSSNPMIHGTSTLLKLVLNVVGPSTIHNTYSTGPQKLSDISDTIYYRQSPTFYTNYAEPNIDNRKGVTAADASAKSLGTIDTSFQTIYLLRARVRITAGTSPSVTYTLTWTEGGATVSKALSASAVGGDAYLEIIIQPDNGTSVTAQITALSGTGATVNVAAQLLPVSQ